MTSLGLVLCVLLVLFSAVISASEVALFSLSRFQLRFLKDHFRVPHRRIRKLLSDPGGVLISVLVLNEILNITIASIITGSIALSESLQDWRWKALASTLVSAPIILLFCEITPKVMSARMNQLVAPATSGLLTLLYEGFRPIRFLLKQTVRVISLFRASPPLPSTPKDSSEEKLLRESDFLILLEDGLKEGAIQQLEVELIKNVLDLDNTTAAQIVTPLSEVLCLPYQTTLKEALAIMRSQRYSRIPVLGPHRREVLGILYAKDLLHSKLQTEALTMPIGTLMRKPFFIDSKLNLSKLFRKFKLNKVHMAIVKSSIGETLGVVTMSDILDHLFEDLFENIDSDETSTPSVESTSSLKKNRNTPSKGLK